MFSSWTLILAIKAAKALVLPSPQVPAQGNATADTSLEAVSVDPVWQTNTSINPLNVSTDVYYYCDTKFGIEINSESCYRAITRVPDYTSTVQRTFGTRGTGVRYDFTLPKWFISRAYTLIKYGSVPPADSTLQWTECVFSKYKYFSPPPSPAQVSYNCSMERAMS